MVQLATSLPRRYDNPMGEVRVPVRVSSNSRSGRSHTLQLLVDTGATIPRIPESVLKALGVLPDQRVGIEYADGRAETRRAGFVQFRINGATAVSLTVFGKKTEEPLLGVTVLEQLGLAVDPVRGKLIPSRLLLPGYRVLSAKRLKIRRH